MNRVMKFLVLLGFSVVATGSASFADSTTTSTPSATQLPNVSIAMVGDMELGNSPQVPSSPLSYFSPIKQALAAPIVFGNLEGTITNSTTSKCGATSTNCYAFKVPPSFAKVYRAAGFTVLNSANNHSSDFGAVGVATTSQLLKEIGIAQAGLPGQIAVVREGTSRVAFVDFAPYSTTNSLLNLTTAKALILRARKLANVVVVYMHAGAEGSTMDHVTRTTEYYVGENRGNPFAFAHAAINDGADLVVGSGPHVLRGMEWYRGHLIAYSLGNFANYFNFSSSGTMSLSGILHITLSSTGAFVEGHFVSVLLQPTGRAVIDPTRASARLVTQLSRQDFGSHGAVLTEAGNLRSP